MNNAKTCSFLALNLLLKVIFKNKIKISLHWELGAIKDWLTIISRIKPIHALITRKLRQCIIQFVFHKLHKPMSQTMFSLQQQLYPPTLVCVDSMSQMKEKAYWWSEKMVYGVQLGCRIFQFDQMKLNFIWHNKCRLRHPGSSLRYWFWYYWCTICLLYAWVFQRPVFYIPQYRLDGTWNPVFDGLCWVWVCFDKFLIMFKQCWRLWPFCKCFSRMLSIR